MLERHSCDRFLVGEDCRFWVFVSYFKRVTPASCVLCAKGWMPLSSPKRAAADFKSRKVVWWGAETYAIFG